VSSTRPLAILDPAPREMALMFRPDRMEELQRLVRLAPGPGEGEYENPSAETIDSLLPEATYVIGQTDLPRERLERAPNLRAVINVESNFLPNIDYEYCFANHIHVIATSPVFARAVAELGLGMALTLARGIAAADQRFRAGTETYGLEGNEDALLLGDLPIGIIGFGDLGKALLRLLAPFGRGQGIRVHDPWQTDRAIAGAGAVPGSLHDVLSSCRAIFVVAGVTSKNEGFLDRAALDQIQRDSLFVLLSRAAVVDFEALTDKSLAGELRVATDVWPDEPFDPAHRIRTAGNTVLSAHRAGALYSCFFEMGERVIEDIRLMNKDLPPASCKRAEFETVTRMRSAPVTKN